MKLNKKKWFNTQLLEFEVMYYGYPIYSDNYRLFASSICDEYVPRLTTYYDSDNKPEEINDIIYYFKSMPIMDAFFEARRLSRKHKQEKRQCYITVSYKTVKRRDKKIKELL